MAVGENMMTYAVHLLSRPFYLAVIPTETRESWPLLAVETEVNGDSKSTDERGPSLVGSSGLSCQYKRFFFSLGCSSVHVVVAVENTFSLTTHYCNSFDPIAQQAGQEAVLGHLSRRMCICG